VRVRRGFDGTVRSLVKRVIPRTSHEANRFRIDRAVAPNHERDLSREACVRLPKKLDELTDDVVGVRGVRKLNPRRQDVRIVGATAEPQDAAIAIPVLGLAGTALVSMLGIFALPSLITGYGLLYYKPWSRIVGIVLSAVSLINIPLGTVVGAYGLWVLLNKETERLFSTTPTSTVTPA